MNLFARPRLLSGFILAACLSLPPGPASAGLFDRLFPSEPPLRVEVADPYIELHTGAGRGFPIFHVEERGARIEILKRKTDWFKVRTRKGREGWVAREQLQRTLTASGEPTEIRDATLKEFAFYRFEFGAMGGVFDNNDIMTVYGGFAFTPNLSLELSASERFSDFSSAEMANLGLLIHPFPGWRVSPFFTVGTGIIRTRLKPILGQGEQRDDQLGHVGAGLRVYLTRRFIFRAQYKNYVIFRDTNDNKEINEWQAGLSVFF